MNRAVLTSAVPPHDKNHAAQPGLLEAKVSSAPCLRGGHTVAVKVIEILGDDTKKTVKVKVK